MRSSQTLYRLSGIALIIGSILLATGYAISSLLLPQGTIGMYTTPFTIPAYLLQIFGAIFLLIGLPGIIVRQLQAPKSGKLSLISFVMTFLGLAVVEVSMNAVFAFIFPALAARTATQSLIIDFTTNQPVAASTTYVLGLALEIFGTLLLGIAIVRARAFPRLAGAMLIVASVLNILDLPDILLWQAIIGVAFSVVFGLSFAWCGYSLLSQQKQEEIQTIYAAVPHHEEIKDTSHVS